MCFSGPHFLQGNDVSTGIIDLSRDPGKSICGRLVDPRGQAPDVEREQLESGAALMLAAGRLDGRQTVANDQGSGVAEGAAGDDNDQAHRGRAEAEIAQPWVTGEEVPARRCRHGFERRPASWRCGE